MASGGYPNPYDLPAGKEYHLFIACSGLDSRKGKWLLEELESKYPFKCVYHERDFQPGEMIVDNMRVYIEKSVKVLLLISNGFLQSYHCKLEETFAISLSNETGRNCIIPVLLEGVELPPVLRHVTYIDATLRGDVAAQIREAYCRTANQITLAPNLCNIGGDDNGKRIGTIVAEKTSFWPFTCRYRFDEASNMADIEAPVEIDAETSTHMEMMCRDVITTLNASKGLRWYGFFTPLRQVFWTIVVFVAFSIIVCCSYIGKAISDDDFDYGSTIQIYLIVGASTIPSVLWILPFCFGSWEYVLLYLRNRFSDFAHQNDSFEEWADKLIENTVAYYAHDLIHWEDLPRSYYNRHDTWKQRECICQLLEPHLSGIQLGQHIWFTSLSKREHKTFSNGYVDYGRTIIL